jgi:hypothetical protein
MDHANELITQLIRKQRLFVIYNGHDPSSFAELVHVAYMQIERTLYKYRARPHCRACFSYDRPNSSVLYNPSRFEFGIVKPYKLVQMIDKCPHCGADLTVGIDNIVEPQQGLYGGTDAICYRGLSKVFNLWSQVSRTVILAYVKKDTRDTRNGDNYTIHINKKPDQNNNEQFVRALIEAKNEIWFNGEYCDVINSLIELSSESDSDKNLKRKLMEMSGKNKRVVEDSLSVLRVMMNLYSEQFDNGKLKCS